jgi:hypothetical protein
MTIKIAISYDTNSHSIIHNCCLQKDSIFFEIFDNYFGISSNNKNLSYGKVSHNDSSSTNLKSFIEINKCATELYFKNRNIINRFFKNNQIMEKSIYESVIFDNKFFQLVFDYCQKNKITIKSLKSFDYKSNFMRDDETFEDINNKFFEMEKPYDIRIQKMALEYHEHEIIIDYNGYIDIAKPTIKDEDITPVKEILTYGLKY